MSFPVLVTDRTEGAEYTYEDLNRVESAVAYLAAQLNGYGYAVSVTTKTDWMPGDHFRADMIERYRANVAAIKAAFYGTVSIPETMMKLTYAGANAIEALLQEVEGYIDRMIAAFRHCGEVVCGGGVML